MAPYTNRTRKGRGSHQVNGNSMAEFSRKSPIYLDRMAILNLPMLKEKLSIGNI